MSPGNRFKFVYEGHRVKFKVIGAKMGGNNSGSVKHSAMKLACRVRVFVYGGSNDVTAIFIT